LTLHDRTHGGPRLKRITLLRRGLAAAALALWLQEAAESLLAWRGISPRADQLLDHITGVLTVIVGLWMVHEHYARVHSQRAQLHEQRLRAVFTSIDGVCQEAGVTVPGHEGSRPDPCVKAVSSRQGRA
jgi:type II secretory pathway component PulM